MKLMGEFKRIYAKKRNECDIRWQEWKKRHVNLMTKIKEIKSVGRMCFIISVALIGIPIAFIPFLIKSIGELKIVNNRSKDFKGKLLIVLIYTICLLGIGGLTIIYVLSLCLGRDLGIWICRTVWG